MSVETISAPPEVQRAENGPEPYSEAWWHERSAEELRLIMSRGFKLGTAFDGATAEAERRARERLHNDEEVAVATDVHNKRMRRMVLEGLLLACLLIVIAIRMMS